MRLDHPSYIKLVLAAYHEKRLNNELPPLLMHSTPANIRKECATVYQERYDKKDEPMLRAFFGPAERGRRFQVLIEKFDVNKFKPLDSFLKEEGKKGITETNRKLLEWLIDFKHRPFVFGMEVLLTDKECQVLGIEVSVNTCGDGDPLNQKEELNDEQESGTTVETGVDDVKNVPEKEDDKTPFIVVIGPGEAAAKDSNKSLQNSIWKKPAAIGLISAVLLGTIYFGRKPKDAECMYWTGERYERVDCDAEVNDRITYNAERLKTFQKIINKDTISEKSIGVVHYYGNKNREFFTSGGKHPVENTRYVKVMTRYIWEKEFGLKDSVAKNNSIDQNKEPVIN